MHKSGNGCVICLPRSWFVSAEIFLWCQIFGLCISEFFVCIKVNELFNNSIYSLLFLGLKDTAVTIYVPCFCFRFIKTSAVIASAPELDLPTRVLYFDKMISTLEELQTGKNNL